MIFKKLAIITFSLFFISSNFALGAGSDGGSGSKIKKLSSYDSALTRIKKAKKYEQKGKDKKAQKFYKDALKYLYKANKEKPFDPDTLNYLGFVNRKVDNFKDSEVYYLLGLEIKPDHYGINEYLGELYVATNRIELAKERLEVLKNCSCEEYQELKDVIEGTKKSKY
jgi:tetratricopeptide (TPR) repeat protein